MVYAYRVYGQVRPVWLMAMGVNIAPPAIIKETDIDFFWETSVYIRGFTQYEIYLRQTYKKSTMITIQCILISLSFLIFKEYEFRKLQLRW